jgi:hypothetical protein
MSLVLVKRSAYTSLFMHITCNRLKVEHILAFADALRAEGVALDVEVDGSVSQQTLHCTGLSVRVTEEESR